MTRLLIVFLAAVLVAPWSAHASEPGREWLTTSLFVAAEAALVIDLGQTIDRGAGNGGHEQNPLLGDRPGRAISYGYFGGLVAAEALTYWRAPRWISRTVSLVTLGLEVPEITHNFHVGVRVRF